MKPGKGMQQQKKKGTPEAKPAPAFGLRIGPIKLGVLFASFSVLLFEQWWHHFPIVLRVFSMYWARDAKSMLPVFPGFLTMWGDNAVSTLVLAAFEVVSWRAGRRALSWVTGREQKGLWGFLLATGLGNGILGTLTLGIGMNGLLFRPVFTVLLAVPLAFSIWRAFRWRHARAAAGNPVVIPRIPALGRLEWVFLGFSVFISLFNYIPALEPEWFYDSLVYHLGVPSRWLVHNKVCALPDTFFSNFPFLQEMQYMFFLALGRDISARLLHWFNGVQCMLVTYALARPLLGRSGGLIAAAVFSSLPQLRFLQHVTMVELGLSWFAGLAMHAFMRASGLAPGGEGEKPVPRRAWLFLAAWFLGLGQGTKYLGIFISALLVGWLVLEILRGRANTRRTVLDVALITVWGSVWTGPWLAKNWLFTGNPVFPMMGTVFPAINWDAPLHGRWMHDNTKYGTGRGSLFNWLLMPIAASVETPHFGTFTLNPFFLVVLPVLVFLRGVLPPIRFLGGIAGAFFVVWMLTSQQTRFLMPVAPAASVATAFVITMAFQGRRVLAFIVKAAAAWMFLVSAYGEIQNRYTNNAMVPFVMGSLGRSGILDMGVQYYQAVKAANAGMPERGRLLFLGGDENYYCRRPLVCSSIYDRCAAGEMAKLAKSPEDLRERMRRRRITHILYYEPRADEYSPNGMFDWGDDAKKRFLSFWWQYGNLVFQGRGTFLFELTDKPLPAASRKTGVPLCFHPPETIVKERDLMLKADALFQAEKYDDGLQVTKDLVKMMPDLAHAWSYHAYAWGAVRDIARATSCYEKSIRLGFPTVAAYYNLGVLYEQEKRYNDAIAIYLRGLGVEPGYTQLKERTAELAFSLGKNDLALRLFTELASVNPEKPRFAGRVRELKAAVAGRKP